MRFLNLTIKTLSTFFYTGYLPFMPGTFASIVAVLLVCLVRNNNFMHLVLTLVFLTLGFLISGRAESLFKKKDASFIVIDEVAGVFLSFIFIPYDIRLIVIGFFLFRILDALKPYPAGSIQELRGSLGIMGDDIVAGLYTNIILQVVLRLASFNIS